MKVGDLVKAPWLSDHDRHAVGIVLELVCEDPDGFQPEGPGIARVLFANAESQRYVYPHLLEVVSEAKVKH